jgi:hypothetical protein
MGVTTLKTPFLHTSGGPGMTASILGLTTYFEHSSDLQIQETELSTVPQHVNQIRGQRFHCKICSLFIALACYSKIPSIYKY